MDDCEWKRHRQNLRETENIAIVEVLQAMKITATVEEADVVMRLLTDLLLFVIQ